MILLTLIERLERTFCWKYSGDHRSFKKDYQILD